MCVSHLMNLSNIIKGKNTRPHRIAAMEQKRKKFINLYGNARYRIRTNELRGSVQMVFFVYYNMRANDCDDDDDDAC